jgi:omega-6 fatty acid desaturase (delta-12 desaturase)
MDSTTSRPEWLGQLKAFEHPVRWRAVWQLVSTLVPYAALLYIMYFTIQGGYPVWVTLLLAVPTAAFVVRIFVIFHDCSHGSYFKSQRANRAVGAVLGVLTFTAYGSWKYGHGIHHSSSGNLDRRTIGEIWTLTVAEYQASSWWKRAAYRIYRNPFFLFGVAPVFLFVVLQRFPDPLATKRQIRSIIFTDIALVGIVTAAAFTIGLGPYLLIQLPVIYLAAMGGVWLFYVQHQFDPGYWERAEEWDSVDAAIDGSSYYKLPRILQWFTANIGLHHVHHLRPRIPNYNLQRCLDAIPELRVKDHLTVRASVSSMFMNLWDEENKRLVSFGELDRRAVAGAA